MRTDVDFGTARFVIDDTAVADRNRHVFQIASDHASHVLSGLSRVVKGRRELGVALPRKSLLLVRNDNVKQFIRQGANQNDGTAQREVLLVDARGVVEASCPMTWDFDAVTSATAYPVDARTLTVKGGVFTTRANAETSEYRYFARGIAVRAGLQCAPFAHRTAGTLPDGTVIRHRITPTDSAEQAFAYTHLVPQRAFFLYRPERE